MPGGRSSVNRGKSKRNAGKGNSNTSQDTSSSALDDSADKTKTKKIRTQPTKPTESVSNSILSHFTPLTNRHRSFSTGAMSDTRESLPINFGHGPSSSPNQQHTEAAGVTVTQQGGTANEQVTNADLMKKLCSNGYQLEKLSNIIEELRGDVHLLQTENEQLKKEVTASKRREENLRADIDIALRRARLADDKSDAVEQYTRNYNLRVYNLSEPDTETADQCEDAVLKLFHDKLGLRNIQKKDLDAVHRLGRREKREGTMPPRGVIVRFMSRKVRDEVIKNRKNLKASQNTRGSPVIVEDLTKNIYQLYTYARLSPVTSQCWTTRGKVLVKAKNGRIIHVTSRRDLDDQQLTSTPRHIHPPSGPRDRPSPPARRNQSTEGKTGEGNDNSNDNMSDTGTDVESRQQPVTRL